MEILSEIKSRVNGNQIVSKIIMLQVFLKNASCIDILMSQSSTFNLSVVSENVGNEFDSHVSRLHLCYSGDKVATGSFSCLEVPPLVIRQMNQRNPPALWGNDLTPVPNP